MNLSKSETVEFSSQLNANACIISFLSDFAESSTLSENRINHLYTTNGTYPIYT